MTHAVLTGPIKGIVTLDDGTVIDVQENVVYLDTPEQAAEVAQLVGDRYAEEGHPEHMYGEAFVHDADQTAENLTALTDTTGTTDSEGA